MLDIGWTELLVIGIVALIVIGPKDLPVMFHTLGKMMARLRAMSREFSRAMDDAARQSGVGDVSKTLRNVANPSKMGLDAVRDAANPFKDTEKKKSVGPNTQALSEERAEAKRKILEATTKKANERLAAEKAAQDAASDPAPQKTAAKPKQASPKSAASAKTETKKGESKAQSAKPKAKKTTTQKAPAKKASTKSSAKTSTTTKSNRKTTKKADK